MKAKPKRPRCRSRFGGERCTDLQGHRGPHCTWAPLLMEHLPDHAEARDEQLRAVLALALEGLPVHSPDCCCRDEYGDSVWTEYCDCWIAIARSLL